MEKSGQAEFEFEYGDDFGSRLRDAAPTFAKTLVRYNPQGDSRANENQRRRLKVLSDHLHTEGYKFMFELLLPATEVQLESVGQDHQAYDYEVRPKLTVLAMNELQTAGIEPDVWKLEGVDDPEAARNVVAQARAEGRNRVGIIVLGRGEDEKRVRQWLSIAAQVDGVIGFAVGRTVSGNLCWTTKMVRYPRAETVNRIAGTYHGLYRLFVDARSAAPAL